MNYCVYCKRKLMLVQNAQGERFWVTTGTGTRWCPARREEHA